MSDYLIVNPSAGNVYYDVSGSATTGSTQPKVVGGAAQHLNNNTSTLLDNVPLKQFLVFASQVLGSVNVAYALWGASVSSVTVAASSGYARYTKTSHGLSVGDVVNVADTNSKVTGPQRVVTVVSSSVFETDKAYTSGAGTITYRKGAGNFATMTAGKWVMRRVSTELAGQANTTLTSGSSDFGVRRSIHKVEHGRVYKVATAIRAGYWDEYNGVFTTAPTNSDTDIGDVAGNTVTNGTADQAATPTLAVPGELVYFNGGLEPVMEDYDARTST